MCVKIYDNSGLPWNNILTKKLDLSMIADEKPTTYYKSINVSHYIGESIIGGITANTEVNTTSSSNGLLNNWIHIVLPSDGANANLIVDGTVKDPTALTGTVDFNQQYAWVLGQITTDDFSHGGNFEIDELAFFNRVLDANEISTLGTSGITSLENDETTHSDRISPNPAKEKVHLTKKSQIFNAMGEQVKEGEGVVSLEGLNSGIYFVKSGSNIQKLIKE